jgi:hypothetical protein
VKKKKKVVSKKKTGKKKLTREEKKLLYDIDCVENGREAPGGIANWINWLPINPQTGKVDPW